MVDNLKMSRLQVADYLGVSERTLYRWMFGDSSFPRMVFIALKVLMNKPK
jgi:DNA-binding transcriptional regulator YiaG